jgi:uncharacterized protein with FMN-binding domain
MRIFILLLITARLAFGCRETSNSSLSSNEKEIKVVKEKSVETSCGYKDGTYSATVDYCNPKTAHTAKYELEIHVKDCKIVQIDFPNGGWLDEDHISQTQINRNREAVLKDDKGRLWKIHLH